VFAKGFLFAAGSEEESRWTAREKAEESKKKSGSFGKKTKRRATTACKKGANS